MNQRKTVVLDMVKWMKKRENITAGNFFTSLSLAEEQEKQQLTLLGTWTVPDSWVASSILFGFQKWATIISCCL